MGRHKAVPAEQIARRSARKRSAHARWHLLGAGCGAPWRDLPICYGPRATCCNRFVRWRRAGVWGRIMDSLAAAHDAAVQMIDTSIVRVHQHAACIARNRSQSMGRSRGGLTSKIHAVVDTNGLPVRLGLTAGEAHDNRLALSILSRLRSGSMLLAASWIYPQSFKIEMSFAERAPGSDCTKAYISAISWSDSTAVE